MVLSRDREGGRRVFSSDWKYWENSLQKTSKVNLKIYRKTNVTGNCPVCWNNEYCCLEMESHANTNVWILVWLNRMQ